MRILMRAAKDPLEPKSAIDSIRQNTLGNNSGNLMFAAASHALLATNDATIETIGGFSDPELAARANSEFDGVVLPLANCFRKTFEKELKNLTRFVEGLKVPFAMLSGGAQLEFGDNEFRSLTSIRDSATAFCRAVLEKSDKITVRGERTAEYVRSLGFADVEVIGCPSLTRMGEGFQVSTAPNRFGPRVAYNVEVSKDLMAPILENLDRNGAELTYVPQDIRTLEMMVWGRDTYPLSRASSQPLHRSHRQFSEGTAKFFLDASTWIEFLQTQHMAVGPRIHGIVAAISAAVPGLLIAHDQRTKELAEYHKIPHLSPSEIDEVKNIEDLWMRMDYSGFNAERRAQVRRVVAHLEKNSFVTTLSAGREPDRLAYFAKLSTIDFPGAVSASPSSPDLEKISELRRKIVLHEERLRRLESKA